MKAINPLLKIALACILFLPFHSFAQRNDDQVKDRGGMVAPTHKYFSQFPISCSPATSSSCNYIRNNDFTPSVYPPDPNLPVNLDQVLPWQSGSGSVAVYPGTNCDLAPPPPATSYAFGGVSYFYSPYDYYGNESIVQKIPAVIPGHTYVLSFFVSHKNYSSNPYIGIDYPLAHFNIHLINCDDYNTQFHPDAPWPINQNYDYIPVPANSQQIYCQNNVANQGWDRVFVHFVAQQPDPAHPLNMIWIWPEGNTNNINEASGMFVALPELIDISDYANQVQQATTPGCLATLPSCGPAGAILNWEGPGGNPAISVPAGTPVTVDVTNPANVGTWTLTLTVPSAVITSSACNTTGSFTTTVQVLPCQTPPPCTSTIDCTPVGLAGCNYARNGDMTASPAYNPANPMHVDMPYRLGLIPNWKETNGTPQVYDNIPSPLTVPPPTVGGYAYLFSTGAGFGSNTAVSSGDGIAQTIPALTPNNSYAMTFFKKFVSAGPASMKNFYVVLMHCSDFQQIRTCNNTIAAFPANSQVVYCEQDMSNSSWEQVFFCFSPNDNYDMVWVLPQQDPQVLYNNGAGTAGVDFTGLEFISTSNFNAGPSMIYPVYPNCTFTIGPSTPNCGVRNAVFEWVLPNGSTTPAQPSQQMQATAIPTYGQYYTLQMTVPSAVMVEMPCLNTCTDCFTVKKNTNALLGGNCYLSATVTLYSCGPVVPPPTSTGPWVWMSGNNSADHYAVYGTQGVPSANINPGSRWWAMSWTVGDDLWLFGGRDHNWNNPEHQYSDLWKYNTVTNQWTWVRGSNLEDQPPVYGTQGVSAPTNEPGARRSAATWYDGAGNLWMFGGVIYSNLGNPQVNDLWKYNIATNEWTWVKGDNTVRQKGVYGTQGVASPTNKPGARGYNPVTWADNSGNLWMFGGLGYSTNVNEGPLNDLWKYNIATNQWTWMKGPTDNNVQPYGIYGTQGVPAGANNPGIRYFSTGWVDAAGYFWLFGGTGYSSNAGNGYLDDLWKYDPATNQWTWIKGSNLSNQSGMYGIQGTPAPGNKPGAKEGANSWTDNAGNLWLFGGYGLTGSNYRVFNELWKFNVSTQEWTWIGGSRSGNVSPTWGTQGLGTPYTNPGSRWYASLWKHSNDVIWLFGGYIPVPGHGNDLWKYTGNCTGPGCLWAGSGKRSAGIIAAQPLQPVNLVQEDIKAVAAIQSVQVYNLTGQLIRNTSSIPEINQLLKAGTAYGILPGVYLLRVLNRDKTFSTVKRMLH